MMVEDLSLQKGKKFYSFEELAAFVDSYQLQQRQEFSVHKSKTIKAANVQRNIKQGLIYYSLHYVCQRSGTYKAKGKGMRKTTSIKTNCPAFIKIKVAKYEDCLKLKAFNDEHNHPPLNELSKGQSEEVEATTTGGDDVLPTDKPEFSKGHDGLGSDLDIANLSVYIASKVDSEERRIDFTNISGDLTLPVQEDCVSKLNTESKEWEWDEDLAAISDVIEYLTSDEAKELEEIEPFLLTKKTNVNSHSQEDCVSKLNTESKAWEWDEDLAAISDVIEYLTSDEGKE